MKFIGLTQRVEDLPERKERRDCLDQAWTKLLLNNGFCPIPLPNCVGDVDSFISNLNLTGVILTGGNDLGKAPERDLFENNLLTVCTQRKLPVLGVCRGLELMNIFYGGKIEPVTGHVATIHDIRPGLAGKMPLRSKANSFHDFGIKESGLSNQLIPTAFAADGTVEAVMHKNLPQWGIMWHPERGNAEESDQLLIRTLFS
jgi:N5-(cytidine 5'-diphosphoramidyl)-L-glutamine hydrolase